jgi:ribulose-5-phosphate 4-epimerase/fuculose-1-phosphate aldolase
VTAVIHARAPQAILIALTGTHFLPISVHAGFIGDVQVVPFVIPGTDELEQLVAGVIGRKGVGMLMQNHGLVVAGSCLRSAADTTEAIEKTAEKILPCKATGIESVIIPEERVKQLKEKRGMMVD